MSKPRRSPLSGLGLVAAPALAKAVSSDTQAAPEAVQRRRSATKDATIQQTVYLPPAVHDQLRELAFAERVKMHAIIMEGLDAVFQKRGMKSIEALTRKQ